MYCPKCGKEVPNENFCNYCGEPLKKNSYSVYETELNENAKGQCDLNRKKRIWICIFVIAIGAVGVTGFLGNKLLEKNQESSSGTEKEKANFYEDDICSFEYPEEWIGKVEIIKWETGEVSVKQAKYNKEYGGVLYDIQYSELSEPQISQDRSVYVDDNTYENPGYITCLATSESGIHAYLSSPTDVQVSPEDELFYEYQTLASADLSILERTFEFK